MTERKGLRLIIPDDAPSGTVQAVFSTFDVLDKQRDIVKRKAFADLDGAGVPLIWSHDWGGMAVGKGHIVVQPKQAVFDGAFHLQTQYSRDAYETVKAMAGLQEYSYGFDIAPDGFEWTEADDGEPARIVTKIGRVYEVSPVLVGAGEDTRTLAIKGLAADLDALKAGRTISAATRARIQQAVEALQALLGAPDDDASDEGKAVEPEDEPDDKDAPADDGAAPEPDAAPPLPAAEALVTLRATVAWARAASDRDVRTHDAALRSLADALRDGREVLTRRVAQAEVTASVDLQAIRAQLVANAAYYGLRGTEGGD